MQQDPAFEDRVSETGLTREQIGLGWYQGHRPFLRIWMMAMVLAAECVPVTMLRHPWLRARTESAAIIFFGVALLFFGRSKLQTVEMADRPIDRRMALVHAAVMALFIVLNLYLLYWSVPDSVLEHACLVAWYGALGSLPVTLALTLFSWGTLKLLFTRLGSAWGIAAICGLLTMSARNLLMLAWDAPNSWLGQAMQRVTFRGVEVVLSFFYPHLIANPDAAEIGTRNFEVQISGVCSGIEGLALMLGLTVGWLVYSWRELRMARAVWLVPVSLILVCLMNMVRISALIAIGDAGHGEIALGGFHSEAGWILFSAVALVFLVLVNRVAWFQKTGAAAVGGSFSGGTAALTERPAARTNEAAVYLLPVLAILGASLLTQAASAGFERFYGLRLVAAVVALLIYRREYRRMDWRFGWLGPAAGVSVFVCWMAWSFLVGDASGDVLANGLAELGSGERAVWLAVRTLAAVMTVPIAEELAFRGFVARRVMSEDVESVSYRRLSWLALGISSVLFGVMHGRMWPVGIVAGLAFGLVAKARGRLGEAVAAHATTNLLLAVWVLARADYSLW